jgi:hypothetical protein
VGDAHRIWYRFEKLKGGDKNKLWFTTSFMIRTQNLKILTY